jgi:two-component system CheB/CheR fusion protein
VVHLNAVERYIPPSMLIDHRNEVLHFSAEAGRYVQLPGGEPTNDIFKLVREPLRARLRIAIDQVRRTHARMRSEMSVVPTETGPRHVAFRVDPVAMRESEGVLLIVFEEPPKSEDTQNTGSAEVTAASAMGQLEASLQHTKERLRALLAPDSEGGARTGAPPSAANHTELRRVVAELDALAEKLQVTNEELVKLDRENWLRSTQNSQIARDVQHLLESTGIATLFLDRDLCIVRFTPQFGETFAIRPTDVGRPLAELAHGLLYDELQDDARRVMSHVVNVDREVASTRGRWYLARIQPYRLRNTVDGCVLTLIDITQRKEAEQSLRESDRRKDEFLAVLAHELRNPLAPIRSGIEILRIASGDPKIVEQVAATMSRQMRQLVRLVDDLLEVSRISGGKLRLRKAKVQLGEIVRDAVATVRTLMEGSNHELTVDLPSQPIVLEADATRLTQVFANLLNNAARYTPEGGRIALRVERESDTVEVSISDNGIGMSPEVRNHVFDMFYQGNDVHHPRSQGLGIGLTLAKSLVELHGGSISVDSAGPDRGAEFKVRLPVLASDTLEPSVGPQLRATRGHRVLVVDDNIDAAQTLSMLIQTLGDNEVHTAASGSEALQAAARLRPDLVLLDLMMPGMDGYEVARRIRKEPWGQKTMLVALTGWGQEEHRRRTVDAGFDQHVIKPVDLEVVAELLARPRPVIH